jgi:hypothetical protein
LSIMLDPPPLVLFDQYDIAVVLLRFVTIHVHNVFHRCVEFRDVESTSYYGAIIKTALKIPKALLQVLRCK